jgi:Tol biopolymer transport system component
MRKLIALVVGVAAITLLVTLPAGASPRGANGEIAFARNNPSLGDTQIYVVKPNGNGERLLSTTALESPRWSPDGRQLSACCTDGGEAAIVNPDNGSYRVLPQADPALQLYCGPWSQTGDRLACEGFGQTDGTLNGIYTVRASDGGGLRRVTSTPNGDDIPGAWSPDGNRLVFGRLASDALFVVNADGRGLKQITPDGSNLSSFGSWSPQGNEIVFSRHATPDARSTLWVVRADGKGLHQIDVQPADECGGLSSDTTSHACIEPVWSPDGRKIAFARGANIDADGQIFTINPDGSGLTQVTTGPGDQSPDWGTHH